MTIAFTLKCRADDVEPGLFRSLKEIGLVRAYVGVELGCQATLDLFAKGVSVERNLEALAILDRLGIVADMRCLLFHPWSGLEMVEEDLAFWRRAAPTIPGLLSFHEVEIFPGTPLAERCRAEGKTSGPSWASTYMLADPRGAFAQAGPPGLFGLGRLQSSPKLGRSSVVCHRASPALPLSASQHNSGAPAQGRGRAAQCRCFGYLVRDAGLRASRGYLRRRTRQRARRRMDATIGPRMAEFELK